MGVSVVTERHDAEPTPELERVREIVRKHRGKGEG